MNDAPVVRGVQRFDNLHGQPDGLFGCPRALEALPFDVQTVDVASEDGLRIATQGFDAVLSCLPYRINKRIAAAAHALKEAGALGAGTGVVLALGRAVELLGPAGLATLAPAL